MGSVAVPPRSTRLDAAAVLDGGAHVVVGQLAAHKQAEAGTGEAKRTRMDPRRGQLAGGVRSHLCKSFNNETAAPGGVQLLQSRIENLLRKEEASHGGGQSARPFRQLGGSAPAATAEREVAASAPPEQY